MSKNLSANVRDVGDTDLILQGEPPEKEMATHSVILAGEIPWTEEPRGVSKESDMT